MRATRTAACDARDAYAYERRSGRSPTRIPTRSALDEVHGPVAQVELNFDVRIQVA
jgi:hypothetical protein